MKICLAWLILASAAVAQTCDSPQYAQRAFYIKLPYSTEQGDFDADGHLDLVSCTEDRVGVHYGDGQGKLVGVTIDSPCGTSATGDLNGDGRDDLVISSTAVKALFIHLATDDGFADPIVIGPFEPVEAACGDVNADGHADVVATTRDETFVVLLGDGTGALTLLAEYEIGVINIRRPRLVDVDLDDDLDLVVGYSGGAYFTFLNDGQGAFDDEHCGPVEDDLNDYDIADMDGDGYPDLVVGDSTLVIHKGLGNGDFGEFPIFEVNPGYPIEAVTIADLDGDGHLDVVSSHGDFVHLWVGNGAGSLAGPVEHHVGSTVVRIVVDDFREDGVPDIAATCIAGDNISMLLGEDGGYRTNVYLEGFWSQRDVVAEDLDDDGDVDFVILTDAAVTVFTQAVDGTFAESESHAFGFFGCTDLDLADVDGDGVQDLVVSSYRETESARILLGLGGASFAPPAPFASSLRQGQLVVADIDADQTLDVAIATRSNDLLLQHGAGDGTFTESAIPVGFDTLAIAAADLDADGDVDLIVGEDNFNGATLAVLRNLGGGIFAAPETQQIDDNITDIIAADLDADGDVDAVVMTRQTEDHLWLLFNDGTGSLTPAAPIEVTNQGARSPIAIDIDGDAILDIVAVGSGHLFFFKGLGGGAFAPFQLFPAGKSPAALALADLDANGSLDAVVPNPGTAQVPNRIALLYDICEAGCPADVNGDGELNILDFVEFQLRFVDGDPGADCDANGRLDVLDFVCFQALFQKGCD